MKINNLNITSPSEIDLDITGTSNIFIFCGHYSSLALDLIRELIGDHGATEDPDRIDDGRFVIHSDVEMDGKLYSACYIRNADFMGDHRLAVNFRLNSLEFSQCDTEEYRHKIAKRNEMESANVFDGNDFAVIDSLSESDWRLLAFEKFISQLTPTDDRPIFIYNFFERIDEAVDAEAYLTKLLTCGRQVFISVCGSLPKRIADYDKARIVSVKRESIDIELLPVGAMVDFDFKVILCPVCACKTLDNHYICSNCNWEYDGFPDDHFSAANGATLKDYREQYENARRKRNED